MKATPVRFVEGSKQAAIDTVEEIKTTPGCVVEVTNQAAI